MGKWGKWMEWCSSCVCHVASVLLLPSVSVNACFCLSLSLSVCPRLSVCIFGRLPLVAASPCSTKITLDANMLIVANVAIMPSLLQAEADKICRRKTITQESETQLRKKGKTGDNAENWKYGESGSNGELFACVTQSLFYRYPLSLLLSASAVHHLCVCLHASVYLLSG